jgi:catechol 2,3-dioxygenase-like lactoylglutathione lyase family enzyme
MDYSEPRTALTAGVDHIGLTVADLTKSLAFFIDCLGWTKFGEKPDYPAAFVTDGEIRLTLWQVSDPSSFADFDRHNNIGLHHLALKARSQEDLDTLFARVREWPDISVEFSPEFSGPGPKVHCMIREPGGCRVEFAWDPR